MKTFTNFMTFEEFLVAFKADDKTTGYYLNKGIYEAIAPAFRELFESGRARPITNQSGYLTTFTDAWNRLIAGEKPPHSYRDDLREIVEAIAGCELIRCAMGQEMLDRKKVTPSEVGKLPRERFDEFLQMLDAGNIEPFMTMMSSECAVTGARISVGLKDWAPTLMTYSAKANRLAPAPPIEPLPPVHHAKIRFKTGHLLVADWFRVGGFTEFTKGLEKAPSINSVAGRLIQTAIYLKDAELISVFSGNSSPAIMFDPETGVVSGATAGDCRLEDQDVDFDDVEFPNMAGSICTDLWWTSIIEREKLIEILKKTGTANAEQVVDDYVASNRFLVQLNVEPGVYNLYFSDHFDTFQRNFRSEEVGLIPGASLHFVLSKEPLTLVDAAEYDSRPAAPKP